MAESGGQVAKVVMQNAAAAEGNGTVLDVTTSAGGLCTLVCQVSGTFSGTITWEATVDGTNWVATGFTAMSDESTVATTATAAGLFRKNVKGLMKVRARISTYASGNITVVGQAVA